MRDLEGPTAFRPFENTLYILCLATLHCVDVDCMDSFNSTILHVTEVESFLVKVVISCEFKTDDTICHGCPCWW